MPRKYYDSEKNSKDYRISRSKKLRKYASVYKSYVRKTEQSKISKSPRRHRQASRSRRETKEKLDSKEKLETKEKLDSKEKLDRKSARPKTKPRKSLNTYQKFVQTESKKEKYREIPGKQRLSAIANEWKKINK